MRFTFHIILFHLFLIYSYPSAAQESFSGERILKLPACYSVSLKPAPANNYYSEYQDLSRDLTHFIVSDVQKSIKTRCFKLNKTGKRLIYSGLVVGSVYTGTLFYLNEAWYKQYARSSFHLYNDNKEWLQMDKAGHLWASYQESVAGIKFLEWCGIERYLAEDCGSFLGLILLTPYEILDGFSAGWGFSLGDMYANLTGSLLALTQAKLWHEQRISLKFSSHRVNYYNDIFGLADEYYGTDFFNRTLKDYNGQTQWVSVNIWSFCKNAKFIPRWLNIAFGYGVYVFDYYDPENYYRQYYFSFDVDFTKIRTRSKVLKTLFDVINCLKVPCPALEYNKKDNWKFHPFYF